MVRVNPFSAVSRHTESLNKIAEAMFDMKETLCQCSCDESDECDPVNHPAHYTKHPSGVECIDIVEHLPFCLGSAIKYIWRCDEKDNPIQDLKKARWFIEREISKRERCSK